MNYWLTADTHFGHRAMESLCGRPPDFEDRILTNMKDALKEGDVLIHLGDVFEHHYKLLNLRQVVECRSKLEGVYRYNVDKKPNAE